MKKAMTLAFAGILTLGLLTACGRSRPPMVTTDPTVPLATVKPTYPTTEATTIPAQTVPSTTTAPTQSPTVPSTTIEDGNGPTPSQMTNQSF